VAVAEHIPLHDMLRVSKAAVVDVNHNPSIYSDNSRSIPC
jgi:hypothetical protein